MFNTIKLENGNQIQLENGDVLRYEEIIFGLYYQRAYSSSIRFETQINQKETPKEQRYAKKIYPVREFTLTFKKNPTLRAELEDFFVKVYGASGLFYWTWEVSRGGNGQRYQCWLDSDDFVQNIDRLGYTDCELKFLTIDNNFIGLPTSYSNYGGQGDRTGGIVSAACSSGTFWSTFDNMANLLNCNMTEQLTRFVSGTRPAVGKWIEFTFAKSVNINEINWAQSNAVSHGVWCIQASNDGINYDTLLSSFTLGGSTSQLIPFLNLNSYTKYRLLGISGNTSSDPWIYETKFKTYENNFNFYHKAKTKYSTKFYTLMDKVITAQNSRRKVWDVPKKHWTLSFEKNYASKIQLENFFMTKRGRFKAFQWTWETSRGGDGQTYWVRFDMDDLVFSNMDEYMSCETRLQEIDDPLLLADNYENDEIIPRKLIKIDILGNPILIIDNDTLQTFTFNGETYLGAPLDLSDVEQSDNTEVARLKATVSNVNQAISILVGTSGDIITNCDVYLYQVLLDTANLSLVAGSDKLIFVGKANSLQMDSESASIDVVCSLGGFEKSAPFMKYGVNCQYRQFKDTRCGYSGSATVCDRTLTTCKRLGNIERFGGFPSMPKEQVIKA